MSFHPFEVTAPHLAYTFLGAFIVIFGMFSLFIKERLYIGEAPLATVVGIIIGPHALGLFDPYSWGGSSITTTDQITLEVTRIIIAVSVFAVGVELPKAYMARHWRSLFFLLGPCMIWGWFVSALLIWGLIPHLNLLSSLVIAACVTPTDPILAQAVVGGKFADKHVPAHIRHLLSAESGSNDGAAFPFLYIAIYLLLDSSPGHAVGEWFYTTLAYEIILGTVLGALLGWVARKVMKFAERKKLIDRQSFVAQYISLAVLSNGATSLLGSDDLLSSFACGCAFAWDGFFNKATEDAFFSNVIDLLFNTAAFIYIGALIPFGDFNSPDVPMQVWRLVVLAILILLVRRLPAIIATYKFIPDIKTFREAIFVGWFGPMGVGAIFISTLAVLSLPEGEGDTEQVDRLRATIRPLVAFLVLSSVLTHGLSIPFFSLGRRVHSITYTWSRQPSMDGQRDEPAWTTHARRILPGQEIVVNRDDDGEAGDIGLRHKETPSDSSNEKRENDSGRGSSSSGVADGVEHHEMTEQPTRTESPTSMTSAEARSPDEGENENNEFNPEEGRRTPPLAEFREGNHLIREHRRGTGNEVDVEVIRNHFSHDQPSQSSRFSHPHSLGEMERRALSRYMPKLEQEWEHAKDEGHDAIDKLRLALSHSREHVDRDSSSLGRSHSPSPNQSETSLRRRSSPGQYSPEEEAEHHDTFDEAGPSGSARPPAIRVNSGTEAGDGRRLGGLRKFFGLGAPVAPAKARKAEEGLAAPQHDPGLLSPIRSASSPKPIDFARSHSRTLSASSEAEASGGPTGIPLTRTISAPRNTSLRFAPDVQASSDTAPSMGNYGNTAPGFKKNPALAMYRASSVQSQDGDR